MSSKFIVCLLSLSIAWMPWATAVAAMSRGFAIPGPERNASGKELAPLPVLDAQRESDLVAVRDGAFEIADRYDPSTFFIEDLLDRLDFEPSAAFEFVRDEIRFDPYDGILRGVEGVLGGRGGNALERSMLLKQLLEEMGFDARLAHGTLTEAAAAGLLEQALTPRQAELDMDPLAILAGFIPGMMARLKSRAERDYAWLMAAAEADIRKAKPVLIAPAAVRQHVWVQANLDGNWTDLDSAFRDASVGQRFTEPERFSKEPQAQDHQVVSFSVVAETWHGKQLSSRPVLQRELTAADAATSRIYLAFAPRAAGTGNALAKAMGASTQFVPILTVDGDASVGDALPGISAAATGSSGFLLASASAPELTGLYLEVKTQSPDGRRSTSRRTLLDRVPARARLAGDISMEGLAGVSHTDGVPDVFNALHQVIVSTGSLNPHRAANNIGLAAHFAGTHLSGDEGIESMDLDAAMWPIAMFRMLSVAVNEWLAIEAVNDLKTVRFLIAEPRIYLFSYEFMQSGENSGIALSIDLLRDDVQAFGAANARLEEVARRKTWYGVFQAAFETSLIEIPYMAGAGVADEMRGASLSSDGVAWRVTAADDKRLPVDVPVMLLEQLGHGHVVVASEAGLLAEAATWWAIGPDGLARAMLAPTLGGSHGWWQSYTNWKPTPYMTKISQTNLHPDMSSRGLQQEYHRAVRDAMREAYNKGGGKAASNRVGKAGKLPRTTRGAGGSEYTVVLIGSSLASMTAAEVWALVVVAGFTTGFIVVGVVLRNSWIEISNKNKR